MQRISQAPGGTKSSFIIIFIVFLAVLEFELRAYTW
jgi:hypothetical protein